MISSSLKKPRTIQSNTPTWTRTETVRFALAVAVMLLACVSAVFGVERSRSRTAEGTRRAPPKTTEEILDPFASFTPEPSERAGNRAAIESDDSEAAAAPQERSVRRNTGSRSSASGTKPGPQWKESGDRRPIAPPLPTLGEDTEQPEPEYEADRIPPVSERELKATRIERTPFRAPVVTAQKRKPLPLPVARPRRDRIEAEPQEQDEEVAEDVPVQRVEPRQPEPRHAAPRALHAGARNERVLPRVSHPETQQDEEQDDAEVIELPKPPTDGRPAARAQGRRTANSGIRPIGAQQLTPLPEPIRDPKQLRKISAILPYYDYEPDPERLKEDPCHNLCPRPKQGCPECRSTDKNGKNGKSVQCLDCPEEVLLSDATLAPRNFPHVPYCWEPTNVWSHPLYFEDPSLERYGHTRGCLQPLWSVGRFGVQLFSLPYQMTIDPVCKKQYALGYYRPGACVPYKYHQAPLNAEAAVVEAGVLTGAFYLFAP